MQDKYRVAIVGLGRMGSTIDNETPADSPPVSVAGACHGSERLRVVSGADIDAAKRQAFSERWGVTAVYDDYLEMIREEEPDIVAICTRGVLHADMTVKTAEAGVTMIYCEKAMACSMVEADAVLEALESRGVHYNTGVLRRFDDRYHQARRMIEAGEIGKPQAAVHYSSSSILHGHIHSIDTLSFLLGDPAIESIWGELAPRELTVVDNRLDKDPSAIYQLTFEGGIAATTIPAGTWEFEIIGPLGSIRTLNNGAGLSLRKASAEGQRDLREVACPDVERRSATRNSLEDLVRAHEQGSQTLGNVSLTHHITEACFAAVESHRVGHRVALPMSNRSLYVFHV